MLAEYAATAVTTSPHQVPCIILPISCLPGGAGGVVGGVASALNPFTYLADALQGILNSFLSLLQALLVKPVLPSRGSALDALYGESLGLRGLGYYLAASAIVVALYVRKVLVTAVEAVLSLLILATVAELTFHVWDWLITARAAFIIDLIHAKLFGGSTNLFSVGDLSGVIFVIIGAGLILYYTVYLIVMLYIEAIAIVLTKFATPIALLVFPYGDRGKNALSWCVAAGFVSCFSGPLVAAGVLEVGKLLVHGFAHSMVADTLFTAGALRTAAKSQRTMYKNLQRQALTRIKGAVAGRTWLNGGNVNASVRQQINVNVRSQAASAHAAAIQPVNANKPASSKVKHATGVVARESLIFALGAGEAKLAVKATQAVRAGKSAHAAKAGVQLAQAAQQGQKAKRGRRRR